MSDADNLSDNNDNAESGTPNREGQALTRRGQSTKTNPQKALMALTSSALLLPGMVAASDIPEKTTIGYRFSDYEEDALPSDQVFGPSVERYDIDIHQFRLSTPVSSDWGVSLDLQSEKLSGASPWHSDRSTVSGNLQQVMSGASIRDDRTDVAVSATKYLSELSAGFSLAYSTEDDYESLSLGLHGDKDYNDRMTNIGISVSYADDEIEPTQGFFVTNTRKDDKHTASVAVNITQIMSANSIAQLGLSFDQSKGYLTDPYKWQDRRPSKRDRWAMTAGYRYFVDRFDAAVHADYRYYWDDWDVHSHTLTLAWHQPFQIPKVPARFQVIPSFRYYTQERASFYTPVLLDEPQYMATDNRLSSYGVYSGSVKLVASVEQWRISFAAERYKSDRAYGIYDDDEEAPGLLSYHRFSFGIDYSL